MGAPIWTTWSRWSRRLSELSESGNVLAGSSYENIETNFPELPTMTYDGPFSDHLASSEPKMLAGLDEVTGQQAPQSRRRMHRPAGEHLLSGPARPGARSRFIPAPPLWTEAN